MNNLLQEISTVIHSNIETKLQYDLCSVCDNSDNRWHMLDDVMRAGSQSMHQNIIKIFFPGFKWPSSGFKQQQHLWKTSWNTNIIIISNTTHSLMISLSHLNDNNWEPVIGYKWTVMAHNWRFNVQDVVNPTLSRINLVTGCTSFLVYQYQVEVENVSSIP